MSGNRSALPVESSSEARMQTACMTTDEPPRNRPIRRSLVEAACYNRRAVPPQPRPPRREVVDGSRPARRSVALFLAFALSASSLGRRPAVLAAGRRSELAAAVSVADIDARSCRR